MDNWRKGQKLSTQLDSLFRHLEAFYYRGEDIDPESGVHHLGLAQCNLSMMVNTAMHHPEMDDRRCQQVEVKPVTTKEVIRDKVSPKTGCFGIDCEDCNYEVSDERCKRIDEHKPLDV